MDMSVNEMILAIYEKISGKKESNERVAKLADAMFAYSFIEDDAKMLEETMANIDDYDDLLLTGLLLASREGYVAGGSRIMEILGD